MTRTDRIANLIGVVLPFLGLIAAIVLLWNRAVDGADLAILAVGYLICGFGVTVGYHRLLTHRAFQTHRWSQYAFAVLGSLAVQGSVIDWVADHRKHHAYTDEEGDPHSPARRPRLAALRGLWHAHVGWLFETHGQADWKKLRARPRRGPRHAPHQPRASRWLALASLAHPVAARLRAARRHARRRARGLLWGGLVRIFFVHHVTWSINSICHFFGRRRFAVEDHSTNVSWLALPSLGEAWHHNHHAFPRSAVHGLRWWELDLSALLIRRLEKLGLAWNVVRIAPERQAAKSIGAAPPRPAVAPEPEPEREPAGISLTRRGADPAPLGSTRDEKAMPDGRRRRADALCTGPRRRAASGRRVVPADAHGARRARPPAADPRHRRPAGVDVQEQALEAAGRARRPVHHPVGRRLRPLAEPPARPMAAGRRTRARARRDRLRALAAQREARAHAADVAPVPARVPAAAQALPVHQNYIAWNEANSPGSLTAARPWRAAQYFDVVARNCRGCAVVAADVLDTKTVVGWVKKLSWVRSSSPPVRASSATRSTAFSSGRAVRGAAHVGDVPRDGLARAAAPGSPARASSRWRAVRAALLALHERFLHDVSHELRTPVTIARGHLELLRREIPAPPSSSRARRAPADRAIIDRLLLLAKAEQPDFVVPSRVAIEPFLEDVFMRWSEVAPRGWRLGELDVAGTCARPEALRSALDALLENAVKYTEPHAAIALRAHAVGRRGRRSRSSTRLWRPGRRGRGIFDRFARADDARTRAPAASARSAIVDAIAQRTAGAAPSNAATARRSSRWCCPSATRSRPRWPAGWCPCLATT